MLVCKLCSRECKSLQSIKIHLWRSHNIKHKEYLIRYEYNNQHPICMCGCRQKVEYYRGKFRHYVHGHWLKSNPVKFTNSKEAKSKRKATNLKKYGGSTPASSIEVRKKIEQTNLEKYGTKNVCSAPQVRQKQISTMLKKYGVNSPLQNKEILNKVKQTNIRKYGVDNPSKNPAIIAKIKKEVRLSFEEVCLICQNKNYECLFEENDYLGCRQFLPFRCKNHNKIFVSSIFNVQQEFHQCPECRLVGVSTQEQELVKFINSLGVAVNSNNRQIIKPKELDLFIPDKQIAIEHHGLYWHSEAFRHFSNSKSHFEKFLLCRDKGIMLLQFFQDEWRDKREICESILRIKLGKATNKISARKCSVESVSNKIEKEFLEVNHLQGSCQSIKNFCLTQNNECVACLTLRKPFRQKDDKSIEIARFSVRKNTIVHGAFTRLFKQAKLWSVDNNYDKIITYSDCRYSLGNIYKTTGFVNLGHTGIDYFYTDTHNRFNRFKFRARNSKSEKEIASELGVYKIYGAGNYLWEYNL